MGDRERININVTIRVPVKTMERWKERGKKENRSLAAFVRNSVEVYLKVVEGGKG